MKGSICWFYLLSKTLSYSYVYHIIHTYIIMSWYHYKINKMCLLLPTPCERLYNINTQKKLVSLWGKSFGISWIMQLFIWYYVLCNVKHHTLSLHDTQQQPIFQEGYVTVIMMRKINVSEHTLFLRCFLMIYLGMLVRSKIKPLFYQFYYWLPNAISASLRLY